MLAARSNFQECYYTPPDLPAVFGHIRDLEKELIYIHTLPCDHSFCKTCISEALSAGRNECTICRMPAWNQSLHKNTSLNNIRQALQELRQRIKEIYGKEDEEEVRSQQRTKRKQIARIEEECSDSEDDSKKKKNDDDDDDDDDDEDDDDLDLRNLDTEDIERLQKESSMLNARLAQMDEEIRQHGKKGSNNNNNNNNSKDRHHSKNKNDDNENDDEVFKSPAKKMRPPSQPPSAQKQQQQQPAETTFTTPKKNKSSHQRPNILATHLDDNFLKNIKKPVGNMDGQLIRDYHRHVTHVVTKVDKQGLTHRTLKYMQGILGGKWIVSSQWIEDSIAAGYWVAEDEYEVKGDYSGNGAPAAGRERAAKKNPLLFTGMTLCFYGEQNLLSRDNCEQVARLGGAKVVEKKTPGAIIVTEPSKLNGSELGGLSRSGKVVRTLWFLDSISKHTIVPMTNYIVA